MASPAHAVHAHCNNIYVDIEKLKGNIQASRCPLVYRRHVFWCDFFPLLPSVLSKLFYSTLYWSIASTRIAVTSAEDGRCRASHPSRRLVVDIVEMLTRERDLGWLPRILGSSTSVICMLHLQPPTSPRLHHTRSRVMFNYNLLLYFGFPGYFVFCIKGFIYIISLWAYLIFDKYLHSIKSTLHSTTISIHRKTFMISIYQPSYRKKYSGFVANTQLRICSQ